MHQGKSLSYNLILGQNDYISMSERLQVIADTDLDHMLEQADTMGCHPYLSLIPFKLCILVILMLLQGVLVKFENVHLDSFDFVKNAIFLR